MKKTKLNVIYLIVILFMFSCYKKEEGIIVNEMSIINKLSANNFYKDFFAYSIISRTPENYLVLTDSIGEFNVNFDKDYGVTLYNKDEALLDKKLESVYSNKYLEIKKTYLFDLNKLMSFMGLNGIKTVVHFSSQRIDFLLVNDNILQRYDNILLKKGVESMQRFWDSIKVIDSNWVILKKRKLT